MAHINWKRVSKQGTGTPLLVLFRRQRPSRDLEAQVCATLLAFTKKFLMVRKASSESRQYVKWESKRKAESSVLSPRGGGEGECRRLDCRELRGICGSLNLLAANCTRKGGS